MAVNRLLVTAFALALVPGCDDDDDDFVVAGDPVAEAQDEGFARGTQLAVQADAELAPLDEPTVIGRSATILAAINQGEIDQAEFAIEVAEDDSTIAYANQMIIEHEEANEVLDDIVRGYGVAFLPSPTADTLAAEAADGLALLRSTPPGDVDFQYIQMQVIMHAQALVLLDELAVQVPPGALSDYIADTEVVVTNHLDEASVLLEEFF